MVRTVGWFAHKAVVSMFLVAGLVAISGCDGGDAGAQTPSVSGSAEETSSTPTPTPTPTAYVPASEKAPAQNVPVPVMPEAAKQQTKEGWEAFAKYFIEELNYMVETNDTSRVEKLTSPNCKYCRSEMALAKGSADNNQWLVNGLFSVESVDGRLDPDREGNLSGLVVLTRSATQISDRVGVVYEIPAVEKNIWFLQLTPTKDGWVVFNFEETK